MEHCRQRRLGVHQPLHAFLAFGALRRAAASEEFFQRNTLGGRFRVQRKMHPFNLNIEVCPEFFNTHGTEIAPGSDVVGEDVQGDGLGHDRLGWKIGSELR